MFNNKIKKLNKILFTIIEIVHLKSEKVFFLFNTFFCGLQSKCG